MNQIYRPTRADISYKNLIDNYEYLKSLNPNGFLCPMIKANAYGHGDVAVAQCLEKLGVSCLGVGTEEEAIRLRQYGIKTDIIFYGVANSTNLKTLLEHKVTPLLLSLDQISLFESFAVASPIAFHIKIDTGMHRFGLNPEQFLNIQKKLFLNTKLNPLGIMTHLALAEDFFNVGGVTQSQLSLFFDLIKQLSQNDKELYLHAYNSSGYLAWFDSPASWKTKYSFGARPGLALYGYSSYRGQSALNLKPILSLYSKVISTQWIGPREGVSYGHIWEASKKSFIGVIPMGYADGYSRKLSNRSRVLVKGHFCPVIGHVTMDNLLVDLTALLDFYSPEQIKDSIVTLIGYDDSGAFISAEELADNAGSIVWETLTQIGERVPRILMEE